MIFLNNERVEAILKSTGVINVTYKNHPVWLEGISNDNDQNILVKDLKTSEHLVVDIADLKE